jgi:hypothetical protein
MSRQPFKRRPLKRGSEILLCRQGPDPVQADGTYFPRWHLAKLSKRKSRKRFGPVGPGDTLWHFKNPKTGVCDVTRVWAYVPRCGSGQGFPSTKVAYGNAPTCKRCLKKAS